MARRSPSTADPERFLPLSPAMFHLLVALVEQEMHGWAIKKEVARRTDDTIQLSAGTLYGLIKRLLREGLIEESDRRPPLHWDDERRRYYRTTRFGRRVAQAEVRRMECALKVARAKQLFRTGSQRT